MMEKLDDKSSLYKEPASHFSTPSTSSSSPGSSSNVLGTPSPSLKYRKKLSSGEMEQARAKYLHTKQRPQSSELGLSNGGAMVAEETGGVEVLSDRYAPTPFGPLGSDVDSINSWKSSLDGSALSESLDSEVKEKSGAQDDEGEELKSADVEGRTRGTGGLRKSGLTSKNMKMGEAEGGLEAQGTGAGAEATIQTLDMAKQIRHHSQSMFTRACLPDANKNCCPELKQDVETVGNSDQGCQHSAILLQYPSSACTENLPLQQAHQSLELLRQTKAHAMALLGMARGSSKDALDPALILDSGAYRRGYGSTAYDSEGVLTPGSSVDTSHYSQVLRENQDGMVSAPGAAESREEMDSFHESESRSCIVACVDLLQRQKEQIGESLERSEDRAQERSTWRECIAVLKAKVAEAAEEAEAARVKAAWGFSQKQSQILEQEDDPFGSNTPASSRYLPDIYTGLVEQNRLPDSAGNGTMEDRLHASQLADREHGIHRRSSLKTSSDDMKEGKDAHSSIYEGLQQKPFVVQQQIENRHYYDNSPHRYHPAQVAPTCATKTIDSASHATYTCTRVAPAHPTTSASHEAHNKLKKTCYTPLSASSTLNPPYTIFAKTMPAATATPSQVRSWISTWFPNRDLHIHNLEEYIVVICWSGRDVRELSKEEMIIDLEGWSFGGYSQALARDILKARAIYENRRVELQKGWGEREDKSELRASLADSAKAWDELLSILEKHEVVIWTTGLAILLVAGMLYFNLSDIRSCAQ